MKGQGCIIGVGSMDYPPEYQGASEQTLTDLAVSKVMTLTSTYDHRIVQGAQSGEFLRRIHHLLLGEDGFYDEVFAALRIPYEPIRWSQDISTSHDDDINKQARVLELIHAYRVRGHIMADTDPLEYRQRSHPDLDVGTHGLTLWDLDREFATGSFGGTPAPVHEAAPRPRHPARLVLPHRRHRVHAHPGPRAAALAAGARRAGPREAAARGAAADPAQAQPGRGVRDVPADEVRRPEALQPRGRRDHAAGPRRAVRGRGGGRARRGVHRHGAPRPAQRAGQHRRQEPDPGVPRVRGQHRPAHGAGLGRREVPPRRRGPLHRRQRRDHQGVGGRQPVAPRGGRPGARGDRPRQAGPAEPGRRVPGAAAARARRRGVRRAGRGGRDAEPLAAARLPYRRQRARRRQQPGGLHHLARVVTLVAVLHRRRPDGPGADLPRQR